MAKTTLPLEFKSATLYALRAVLQVPDTDALVAALETRMREAGAFYENEPVVLDATELDESPDWAALVAALRRHRLHPIGVQAAPELLAQAAQAGLAPLEVSSRPGAATTPPAASASSIAPATGHHPAAPSRKATRADKAAAAEKASEKTATAGKATGKPASAASNEAPAAAADPAASASSAVETLVIRHPLRSGQRIYAKGCDLIVLGMVSQGAEVIADGNIHVYGPLRGKAMAGAHGRTDAMILTTQLDPELLAIAGVYRVIETKLPDSLQNQPAQVSLAGDTLHIRALDEPGGLP